MGDKDLENLPQSEMSASCLETAMQLSEMHMTPTSTSPAVEHLSDKEKSLQDVPAEEDLNLTHAETPSLEQTSLLREICVVGLIAMAQFTAQAALGQVLSILDVIADNLGVDQQGVQSWFIAGYSLTVGTFILLSGRLGDVFGYKRMLVIGYTWLTIWSLVTGLSVYSNSVLFIWSRVLVGIGPSICLPNALALLGILYNSGPRKNMAFAVFGACAPTGFVLGSTSGALFALAWWPWTFWSIACVTAIAAVACQMLIPNRQVLPHISPSLRAYVQHLDLAAATVGITGLVVLNFAWNQAAVVGWESPYVCVCLVLGLLLIPAFFYMETRSSAPLIPLSILHNSTVAFVLACVACGWGSFGIWIYYLFEILLEIRETPPILTCGYLSPLIIAGIAAALTTGWLLSWVKPAWVMVIAMAAFLTGNLLVQTLPPHQIYWGQIFVTTLVGPWGMDMSFPAATIYLSNALRKTEQGAAASLVNTVVNYSISLALGFAGTVEINVNNGGNTQVEKLTGYRAALLMGTGLAGLGLAVSIVFLLKTFRDRHSQPDDLKSRGS